MKISQALISDTLKLFLRELIASCLPFYTERNKLKIWVENTFTLGIQLLNFMLFSNSTNV